ncbi:MAG: FecCD family ABC transporter permease [Terasakiella sp.]|uniref:FecCD family ABC transporter permease n=1 Tax=unclassified Terasakiella TaxID=2614952 RepID=UPI003B0010AB
MSYLNALYAPSGSLAREYHRLTLQRLYWLIVLAIVLIATVLFNVASGPANLSVTKILTSLVDPLVLSKNESLIIWQIRLPYALMSVIVGACLGLAGAELQTVLNNPLASPSTLGIMYAATLGASLAIVFNLVPFGIPENYAVPVFAFVGAISAVFAIQYVSKQFGAGLDTVILFGIAMVFALQALISLIQFVADSNSLQQIVFWTMGSLARATWEKVAIVTTIFGLCLPFSIRHMWKMTALRGGEDYAKSFGISVERMRLGVLFRISILSAAAVAFCGVIGFVGLVGPHIARLAFGEDHRFYLPGAALAGGFILAGASVLSKSIVPGILIPDGIVTALIGIPLFLGLLIKQKRKGA